MPEVDQVTSIDYAALGTLLRSLTEAHAETTQRFIAYREAQFAYDRAVEDRIKAQTALDDLLSSIVTGG